MSGAVSGRYGRIFHQRDNQSRASKPKIILALMVDDTRRQKFLAETLASQGRCSRKRAYGQMLRSLIQFRR
jgi:hypothetical protein